MHIQLLHQTSKQLNRHLAAIRGRGNNMNEISSMFGRITETGDVAVFENDGAAATRIDANIYPVGSETSARHEHPEGIVITRADAEKISLAIEA